MPNRRKSNRAKWMLGTMRRDRGPKQDLSRRLARVLPPPKHLDERAATEWRAVMPAAVSLGTITRADLRAFELLVVTLATETEARDRLRREGMTIKAGSGGRKAHPALKAAETARMQAHRLL